MSYAIEVYYSPPIDPVREEGQTRDVAAFGGSMTCRELPTALTKAIVLTFEFDNPESAADAKAVLRTRGVHVEGPYDYGE
jgi:hypothetical protein